MKMTKLISAVLAVTMLAGLCSIPALADDSALVYAALGDSIPAGYGLSGGDCLHPETYSGRIEGSYPDLVADALGANLSTAARCGFRTVEARMLLDPSYTLEGDELTISTRMVCYLGGMTSMDEFYSLRDSYIQSIKNADILTFNYGSNDTMTYALQRLGLFMKKFDTDPETLEAIDEACTPSNPGLIISGLGKLLDIAKTMGKYSLALAELSDAMNDGYKTFKNNWEWIFNTIYALNPDVQVLALGMYNPFRDLKLTDYSLLSIGKLANQFVGLMNAYMRTLSDYSRTYTYVDVSDAECYEFDSIASGGLDTSSMDFIVKVHPTAAGHAYIARQVLAKVKLDKPVDDVDPAFSCSLVNFVRNSALYKGFKDVAGGAWYTGSVKEAVELGIMSGYGNGEFMPEANIKLCEVIKMAAVSRSTYAGDGYVFDESAGTSWYDTYLAYAMDNGIVRDGEYADLSACATRAQMAHIFTSAMSDTLAPVNSVGFDGIPDVTGIGLYDKDILALYRAGIVEGRDGGYFDPASSITRAECAALIARICTPASRIVK